MGPVCNDTLYSCMSLSRIEEKDKMNVLEAILLIDAFPHLLRTVALVPGVAFGIAREIHVMHARAVLVCNTGS